MSETTWAGRTATPPRPDDEETRSRWLPVVGVIAALGLVGAGGFLLGSLDESNDDDAEVSASETGGVTTTVVLSATSAPLDEVVTTAPSTTEAPTTTEAEPEPEPETTAEPAEPADEFVVEVPDGETRVAVLRGGTLYLGGAVPSREMADQIIQRSGEIVGEENVVDQYEIDPDLPVETGGPLIVDDVVLFPYGSATFDPQFTPLLDLGLMLLSLNPQVEITIIAHTDASGDADYNRDLSFRRGQAVAQYWIDRGIPAEQIVIDARGEDDPRADNNTPVGAQLNRRAEFYIENLIG